MLGTTEIALLVGAAVLLFGVDKLPKLARSAGQAKKEFMVGQAEADIAAARVRDEAQRAAATTVPGPAPDHAAAEPNPTIPTSTAPPHTS
jgi:sec-independent protein translocase protein TatA